MDKKLNKLIDSEAGNFYDWIKIINEHNSMFGRISEIPKDKYDELTYKTSDILGKISNLYIKYGAFKDNFDNSKMYVQIYGPELIIKSEKTTSVYYIGFDNKGFYIRTHMKYSENLRHMSDKFYEDIFYLMDIGNFDIKENEFYSGEIVSNNKDLFSNNKSKIFKLLRNYIIGKVASEKYIILGEFNIHWNYKTDFYTLMENSCLAFQTLYRLNYSLWKIHDLETKKT